MFDASCPFTDQTVTLSGVLERLSPHLAQIKVLHKVFCTGVAEVPPATTNVVRASHLLNTLYKAIIEYDSVGEASEQTVRALLHCAVELIYKMFKGFVTPSSPGGSAVLFVDRDCQTIFGDCG